jgi:hypothetical protein
MLLRAAGVQSEKPTMDSATSDTARAIQHDPDQSYPQTVVIRLTWVVNGHIRIRTKEINADEFFGLGSYGAPIEGAALIGAIESMRRAGPPVVEQKGKKHAVRKARR